MKKTLLFILLFLAVGLFGQTPIPTASPLVPGFSQRPYAPRVGVPIQFTDYSVGAVSWLWDFGDGTTSTLQNPVHVYDVVGIFEFSLTITDENGVMASIKQTH
jgi:PKD repeat protein